MKKNLFFIILLCTTASVDAQSEGNVGINTVTPSATLHVKSKGSTATTQVLKLDNDAGTNLLTINNDGTVSGVAAVNLSSGTPSTPKASGIFSGMTSVPLDGYLSPIGNGFTRSSAPTDDASFYTVAQTVPFDTVLDEMIFSVRGASFYPFPRSITAQLYVNNIPTAFVLIFNASLFYPNQTYTARPVGGTVLLQKGDHFAYRLTGFDTPQINCYVAIRYTEQ